MKTYRKKERMILSRSIRRRRRYIEVAFGNNDAARLLLSKEKGVLFESDKAYLPAEDFVLADFFDRYVNLAFIDYSKVTDTTNKPEKEKTIRSELPAGFWEKLKQMRYSNHTIRVYTTYIGDFQQYFAGSNLKRISPDEINAYLLHLIDKKNISSCQQNQRINAIKFYYEKVLGNERHCYKVNRAKREKTLPDVLSKEEVKDFLTVAKEDLQFYCMYSLLYSAGLRISELLNLKPDDINISRSLIHVRQGKGKKDRYTLLSKPFINKLEEYRIAYQPEKWLFEREAGVQFSESIVSKKLKEIAHEAGITKRVYPHLFRHSFATHLIEQGTDLKIIKELLGHNNIKTTEMYVHIADTYKSKIKSPLDDILEEEI
ncbi:recombinase [Bacteroides fragilis]|uniref:Recombinase n=1 Tax=Bacteroides fragilis TaxID=817 RepID=A0A396BVM1_BACFG|nr:recombinase [Bacteroides fragilis]